MYVVFISTDLLFRLDSGFLSADEIAVFDKLDSDALFRIAEMELSDLSRRASKKHIGFTADESVIRALAAGCGGSAARIKGLMAAGPEDALSCAIIEGTVSPGEKARCSVFEGKFIIERE